MATYTTLDFLPDLHSSDIAGAKMVHFAKKDPDPYWRDHMFDNVFNYMALSAEKNDADFSTWDFTASNSPKQTKYLSLSRNVTGFNGIEGVTYDIFSISYFSPRIVTVFDNLGNAISAGIDDKALFSDYSSIKLNDFVAPYTGIYYVDPGWSQGYGSGYDSVSLDIQADVDTAPNYNKKIDYGFGIAITGVLKQNQILQVENILGNASDNPNDSGTIKYQWLRRGIEITGADKASYTTTQNDVNDYISVKASYIDSQNNSDSVTSDAVTIANVNDKPTGYVLIGNGYKLASENLESGSSIYASATLADADGLGTLSYQWLRAGKVINGAIQKNYILTDSDIGKKISVKVSYTDGFGTSESVTSQQTSVIQKHISTTPTDGNDSITGTNSDDIIDGKLGADTMVGGLGNDDYYVDNAGDKIVENKSDGIDIVGSTLKNYTLGNNLENLILLGSTNINGTGNSEKNLIAGNDGNNILDGRADDDKLAGKGGADTLIGGAGADIFAFTNLTDSGITIETRDTIKDFSSSQGDKIGLIFGLNNGFVFIGDAEFDGKTAEVRFFNNILSLDSNGDKIADFSVKFIGVKSLDAGDFNVTSTFDYFKGE
jgi:Ca2+-binding RTX toxin-like protein